MSAADRRGVGNGPYLPAAVVPRAGLALTGVGKELLLLILEHVLNLLFGFGAGLGTEGGDQAGSVVFLEARAGDVRLHIRVWLHCS